MWNEEKQKQLLDAQDLVQQLEREKEQHRNLCVSLLRDNLKRLDDDYVLTLEQWEEVAGVLIDYRTTVVNLLEEIK